jgi:hypothetical protein
MTTELLRRLATEVGHGGWPQSLATELGHGAWPLTEATDRGHGEPRNLPFEGRPTRGINMKMHLTLSGPGEGGSKCLHPFYSRFSTI